MVVAAAAIAAIVYVAAEFALYLHKSSPAGCSPSAVSAAGVRLHSPAIVDGATAVHPHAGVVATAVSRC